MKSLPPSRWVLALVLAASYALPGFAAQEEQEIKKLSEREIRSYIKEAEKEAKNGDIQRAGGLYLTVLNTAPDRGDVRLELARIHEQLGNWSNAATEYEKAAETLEDPAQILACYEGMTVASAKQANYAGVVEAGRKAIEAGSSSADTLVALAVGLAKTGESEEAGRVARQALEVAPDNALAHSALGEASLAQGDLEPAEGSFRKAIELDQANADAHAGLAEILYRKEDLDGAVASADAALALDDKVTRAYAARGMAKQALGDPAAAESDLQLAISVNSEDPDANLALAQVYDAQGKPLATYYYEKAIQLNPSMNAPYVPLARILIAEDQHDKALPHLQKVTQQDPDSGEAHYLLGLCLLKDEQPDPALDAFTRAAELDADLADAHYHRGKILQDEKKDIPGAIEALEAAVALKGDDPRYLTQYGVALYTGKQLDPALEALSKAGATPDYKDPLGLTYLGIALKDKQRYAESVSSFEKAIAVFPNWGLPHWGLAWSSFGQIEPGCPCGEEGEALKNALIEHANKAVELGTNDPALMERVEILAKGEKVK